MTTAQVVETSVFVNNNSPMQDYVHLDDQTQPFEMTPGLKTFHMVNMSRVCVSYREQPSMYINFTLFGHISITVLDVW